MTGGLQVEPASSAERAVQSDYNGDGYADLAIGVPGEDLGAAYGAGAVEVLYGSRSGLSSTGSQLWTLDSTGVKGQVTPGGGFGTAHTSGDFDADGYADLAVGAVGHDDLGAVTILYGSRRGLSARDQHLLSSELGNTDLWGASLAAGDFDGDGHSDLPIGGGSIDTGPAEQVGSLTVLRGTPNGLATTEALRLTKDSPNVAGDAHDGDGFGSHLAVGDVTGDGRDDLVIGDIPRRPSAGTATGGAYFLAGSAIGITTVGARYFAVDDPAVLPADTSFSDLGSALALGDFDDDGHEDLALGDYDSGPPGMTDCADRAVCPGAVLVLPGTEQGPTTEGKQLWYQNVQGVPGTSEAGDAFGYAVAAGDLNGDGRDDLAVGSLGEDLTPGSLVDAGSVNVIYGSSTGLRATGSQHLTQDSAGIKGTAEPNDYFGSGLQVLPVDRGRPADLIIAANGEAVGDATAAGSVHVLYGSSAGVTARDQRWSQDSQGIAGRAEANDQFSILGS